VVASVNIFERGGPDDVLYWEDNEIVQCRGCRLLSFRKNWKSTDDTTYDSEGNESLDDHAALFPPRIAGRQLIDDVWHLPKRIQNIYMETYSALCNQLRVLSGIGIRALVETVCKDKAAVGKNLKEQIDNLVVLGILTRDGADFLHSLRIMGNNAAHDVEPQTEDDLDIAFDIVEHLLQGVYLLRIKASKLPK
jgi:hypothetical protein